MLTIVYNNWYWRCEKQKEVMTEEGGKLGLGRRSLNMKIEMLAVATQLA